MGTSIAETRSAFIFAGYFDGGGMPKNPLILLNNVRKKMACGAKMQLWRMFISPSRKETPPEAGDKKELEHVLDASGL